MSPVILLHGIGGPAWGPTLPALAGREVLDWPLPGYGGSPALPAMTFPALAAALRDALDAAGIDRADLVGHSIGGMLAQEFAASFPDRVARLVLYATSSAFGARDPAFAETFVRQRLAPLEAGKGMAAVARGVAEVAFGRDADPGAAAAATAAMTAVPEATYRQTIQCLTTFDRRASLGAIAVPTLLIAGELDQMAPLKGVTRMAEAIPGARLTVIPGAGHMAHLEQPARFNAALLDFLES
jgi:3-oxoadipate enol-lactonase